MTVVFLHIPKTGGTTLHTILKRHYGAGFHDENRARRTGGVSFKKMSVEQRAEVALLKGHVTFGFHKFAAVPDDVRYFTFLREPAARVVSLYRHILRNDHHPLHAQVRPLTLVEFLRAGLSRDVDNGQVRAVAGGRIPGQVGQAELDQAKQNIADRFLFVGQMEQFDSSLAGLVLALGWDKVPRYATRNVAPSDSDVALSDLDEIRAANRFDVELREWAAERFGFLDASL